jgi:hypothetical protein
MVVCWLAMQERVVCVFPAMYDLSEENVVLHNQWLLYFEKKLGLGNQRNVIGDVLLKDAQYKTGENMECGQGQGDEVESGFKCS